MNSKFKALLFLFIFQTISSCCGEPSIYEVTYHGMIVKTINNKTGEEIKSEVPINKTDLTLNVDLLSREKQIASNILRKSISGFAFNSAHALYCPPDEYIYLDDLTKLEISVTNTETKQTQIVTENFSRRQEDLYNLISTENIPTSATFTVKATLKSGVILEKVTNVINFI